MSLNISGPESGQLASAIESAVDDPKTLQQVLLYKLNENISKYGGLYSTLPEILLNLIRHHNARYTIDKLVIGILEFNPTNEKLLQFAWSKNILLPHHQRELTQSTPEQTLERMLDPVRGYADPMQFLKRFAQITQCVCRIAVPGPNGTGYGTGLLIGNSTVMTNYHVLQKLIEKAPAFDHTTVEFLFDYHTDIDGESITSGVVHKLHSDPAKWLIDASAYDESDVKVKSLEQNLAVDRPLDKLDYALVRLATMPGALPLGEKPYEQGATRGFIPLPSNAQERFATDFDTKDSAIFVFQHPSKLPLRMDWQRPGVLGVNANRTRVMYDVNTEPGSSGSPCFNSKLELVALHHAGGKDWPAAREYLFNQGIPICTIYQALADKQKLSEIR